MTAEGSQRAAQAIRQLLGGAAGLSVILPCRNLAGVLSVNLAELRAFLSPLGIPYELVPSDDGSDDGSADILRREAEVHPDTRPVLLPDHAGKGAALLRGAAAARYGWLLFLDGDLDIRPVSLGAFCEAALESGADAVLGSKRHPASRVRYPLHRRLLSALYHGAVRTLLGLRVGDTQAGMKLIRREAFAEAAPRLLVRRFAFDLELLAALRACGRTFAEAPVVLDYGRRWGCVTPRMLWQTLRDTLAIVYRDRVLHYYATLTLPPPADPARGPFFSVIVALPGDSAVLRKTLAGLQAQTYRRFEVLLLPDEGLPDLPGDGTDRRVLPTGAVRPAEKRNLGAAAARGDILAFLDDDAAPRPDWLERAAARFAATPGLEVLGGPGVTPPDDPPAAQLSGLVFASLLVSGNFRCRYFVEGILRRVEDFPSCNLFVTRGAFRAVGGFRTDFWPGEDTLLCADLQRAGHAIYYDPHVTVEHRRRALFGPHLRQVARYATHRGYFARRIGLNSRRLSYMLPSLFLVGLALGLPVALLMPLLLPVYLGVVGLWLTLTLGFALVDAPRLGWVPQLWAGVLATHLVYGWCFLRGVLARRMPCEVRPFDHR